MLDFAETGRGGAEVFAQAETTLGATTRTGQGIANLRTVLDLLDAAGVPQSRIAIDLGLARGSTITPASSSRPRSTGWEKFGSVASGGRYDNLASLFTTAAAAGRRAPRSGWTGCWP